MVSFKLSNLIKIVYFRYPAQIVRVDTSGKRFDRMSVARKSLLHVQSGMHEVVEISDDNTVKRRSRSRKPRGKRRNTIAGIDQKEIEGITENGFVFTFIIFLRFIVVEFLFVYY